MTKTGYLIVQCPRRLFTKKKLKKDDKDFLRRTTHPVIATDYEWPSKTTNIRQKLRSFLWYSREFKRLRKLEPLGTSEYFDEDEFVETTSPLARRRHRSTAPTLPPPFYHFPYGMGHIPSPKLRREPPYMVSYVGRVRRFSRITDTNMQTNIQTRALKSFRNEMFRIFTVLLFWG